MPKFNQGNEYLFTDVFENLSLIMIIRREIIHFAIKNKLLHLLSVNNEKTLIDKLGRLTLEKAKKPFG